MNESRKGGARPGSGRKPSDSESYRMKIGRDVRVKLFRFAGVMGLKLQPGKSFWNPVLLALLNTVDVPEPEYLRLTKKE